MDPLTATALAALGYACKSVVDWASTRIKAALDTKRLTVEADAKESERLWTRVLNIEKQMAEKDKQIDELQGQLFAAKLDLFNYKEGYDRLKKEVEMLQVKLTAAAECPLKRVDCPLAKGYGLAFAPGAPPLPPAITASDNQENKTED